MKIVETGDTLGEGEGTSVCLYLRTVNTLRCQRIVWVYPADGQPTQRNNSSQEILKRSPQREERKRKNEKRLQTEKGKYR